jgi:ATP-dependent Clp protease adapter protein ClpS
LLACPPAPWFLEQPETQIKTGVKTVTTKKEKMAQKQKAKTDDPVSKRNDDFQDAPMYKVMLLGDDGADPEHVIKRMCNVMDDMDEDQAATVFQQAKAAGKAMCGKYPYERAELFKEQLLRSDPMIFVDLEEENA